MPRTSPPAGVEALRSARLSELGVPHLFTTADPKAGPVSDRRVVGARQVHGAGVLTVIEDGDGFPAVAVDALVTARPDRLLLVRTADCVPVLLSSSDGRRVGAVHAGWRGLVAGVIPRAIAALAAPGALAVLGPCISAEHFEVGPEVVRAFRDAGLGSTVLEGSGTKARIDLRRAARIQLEEGGVSRVEELSPCTYGDPALPSYRRDVTHGGRTSIGRLSALIGPHA